MKPIGAIAVAMLAGAVAALISASGLAHENATALYLSKIPAGYRDWKLICVAHEEGGLHSFAAVLGNDVASKAYRDEAALSRWRNDRRLARRSQPFVPGPPTNLQFEVKDSTKYAATGGWGFAHFNADGRPGDAALLKTCAPCHAKAIRDFIFTRYAP